MGFPTEGPPYPAGAQPEGLDGARRPRPAHRARRGDGRALRGLGRPLRRLRDGVLTPTVRRPRPKSKLCTYCIHRFFLESQDLDLYTVRRLIAHGLFRQRRALSARTLLLTLARRTHASHGAVPAYLRCPDTRLTCAAVRRQNLWRTHTHSLPPVPESLGRPTHSARAAAVAPRVERPVAPPAPPGSGRPTPRPAASPRAGGSPPRPGSSVARQPASASATSRPHFSDPHCIMQEAT